MTPPGLEATRIARLATLFTRCRSAVSPLPGKLLSRWMPAMAAALFVSAALVWQYTPDPLPALLSRPVSPVLLDSDGELIHARLSLNEEWRLPVPLEAMGTWLPRVLVAVEDKRFYDHHGIDFLALGRALVQNAASGRVLSGASTITSQLVRLGTPRPRTLLAKTMEFVGALKLEARLEKEQILELYLNHAPFGGPIRGVEAAARLYFGKRAKDLSLGEASLLVGLLKGPTAYRPDKNPWAALNRRQQIIALVAKQIAFPADLRTLALEEPLPAFRPSMPSRARHFADLAFKTLPPEGGVVPSSLDTRAQDLLEQSLRERLAFAGPDVTAAGIIVDNRSSSIIAYVGNALFDPERGRHWVDCALAPRSPGSTLKPFIYLAAMDSGRIIPEGLLADTPLRLGGEAPRNFSLRYRGPVTVKTALADSLNTPAVRVLRMVGVNRGLARLRQAGFAHLTRNDEDYGDSLVLGAGEVTLLELARAYSALARLGDDRPLLLRARQTARPDDIAVGRSQALDALAGDMGLFRPVTLPSFTPSGLADVPLQLRSEPGALPSRQIGTPGAA
ncbi:MAG: transglycosylase domain-containing protein, partial [Desulfovibrio sp.]|nr:transglycosylase domain-containing protein [Desulfovibrio sp.]